MRHHTQRWWMSWYFICKRIKLRRDTFQFTEAVSAEHTVHQFISRWNVVRIWQLITLATSCEGPFSLFSTRWILLSLIFVLFVIGGCTLFHVCMGVCVPVCASMSIAKIVYIIHVYTDIYVLWSVHTESKKSPFVIANSRMGIRICVHGTILAGHWVIKFWNIIS